MSIRRITISVPERVANDIKRAAGKKPVSAWVTELIEERLGDAELDLLFDEFYAEVRPPLAAVRRAEAIFRGTARPRRKRRPNRGAA